MFRGAMQASVDATGRMALPMRFRQQLAAVADGNVVVTVDTEETCLLIYPEFEWNIVQEKLETLPSFNQYAKRVKRLLLGHATDIELDGNGRILLTSVLRKFAKLDKKVTLLGQGNKIELWSASLWDERCNEYTDQDVKDEDLPIEMQEMSL